MHDRAESERIGGTPEPAAAGSLRARRATATLDVMGGTSAVGPQGPAAPQAFARRRAFASKVDSIRPTYGFEDVSLAPGVHTVEPADVDLSQLFAGIPLGIPVLAAAMDAVVDARFAGALAALGGLAVLNLEGVQTRYEDPDSVLQRIASAPDSEAHAVLAEAYLAPIREDLVARRLSEIQAAGSRARCRPRPRQPDGLARSAPSTAPTCSSCNRRCRRRGTLLLATTRSNWAISRVSCRSRWRSATRRRPRQRLR